MIQARKSVFAAVAALAIMLLVTTWAADPGTAAMLPEPSVAADPTIDVPHDCAIHLEPIDARWRRIAGSPEARAELVHHRRASPRHERPFPAAPEYMAAVSCTPTADQAAELQRTIDGINERLANFAHLRALRMNRAAQLKVAAGEYLLLDALERNPASEAAGGSTMRVIDRDDRHLGVTIFPGEFADVDVVDLDIEVAIADGVQSIGERLRSIQDLGSTKPQTQATSSKN